MAVQLGAPLLAGLWFVRASARGVRVLPTDPLSLAIYLSLASMAVSILPAINPFMGAIETSKRFSVVCVYVLMAVLFTEPRDRADAAWVLVGTGLIGGVYGITQHFGYDFFPWVEHKFSPLVRGVSFYGHATFAGSYLILVIPLAAGLMVSAGALWARGAAALSLAVMLYHLSFTGARGAALALLAATAAVALAVMVVQRERLAVRRAARWAAALLTMGTLAAGGFLVVQAWSLKNSDLFAIGQISGALRIYTWETACRLFIEHPILGVGTGNYEVVIPLHWNLAEANHFSTNGTIMHQAHNDYLETAAEQGALGLVVLLATLLLALAYSFDTWQNITSPAERRMALAMFGSVVAASVDAMFIFNLQTAASATALWAIFGLIAAQRAYLLNSEARIAERTRNVALEVRDVVVENETLPVK